MDGKTAEDFVSMFYPGLTPEEVVTDQIKMNMLLIESLTGIAAALSLLQASVAKTAEIATVFEQFGAMMGQPAEVTGGSPIGPDGLHILS